MTKHEEDDKQIDTFAALRRVVEALDNRFPDGNSAFQRVSRLTEECGEVASTVNHKEGMGIKAQKYGEASDDHLVKELQDMLRAVIGIARHYDVEDKLEQSVKDYYTELQSEGRLGY